MKLQNIFSVIILSSCILLALGFKNDGKKFKQPKNFAYIPSGTLHLADKTEVQLKGYFIQETEVSNKAYNQFLKELYLKGKTTEYDLAIQSPENWRNGKTQLPATLTDYYHNHKAFEDFPVVTISKKGAELYCDWMTENWQKKYPEVKIKFRLPTGAEWIYAAKGGHEHAPYPWGGFYFRNAKGCALANFRNYNSRNIKFNKMTQTYEVINLETTDNQNMPKAIDSYFPNDYGLYNMSGNVAEMISTPYRTKGGSFNSPGYHIQIEAEDEYEGWTEPSPFIGFRPVIEVKL